MSQHELNIPPRTPGSPPGQQGSNLSASEASRLLKQCREMAQERLAKSLTEMLNKMEETLWNMAQVAEDRETRDLYLQAKDKAKAQRAAIEEQFKKRFEAEFDRRLNKQGNTDFETQGFDIANMALVEDEVLSGSLKVKDLSSKLRGIHNDELSALDQRIGVLVKDPNLKGEDNPLSPDSIYAAFKQACDEMEAGLKVKMVILNLFDQQVHKEIHGIYQDINSLLVKNSVLPQIRFGLNRAQSGTSTRSGAPAGAGQGAPYQEGASARTAGMGNALPAGFAAGAQGGETLVGGEQDLYGLLQSLIVRQHAGGVPVAGMTGSRADLSRLSTSIRTLMPGGLPELGSHLGPATGPVRLLSGAELLGALTQIQQGHASVIPGASNSLAAAIAAPGAANILRDIKSTPFGRGMGEVDNMTLDIVSLLFDHILDDRNIPDAVKALIGRLQIPILKVAILDRTFFQKKQHPARRMLNILGEFGLGLGAGFQTSNPLFKQVGALLQRLIDQFQDDLSLFEKTQADLEQLINSENRRAQEEAARTAGLLEFREKLEVARAIAQIEVKKRAESGQMPHAVLKFIAEEWIKLLVTAHAKAGPESTAWKSVIETMDQLIWSASAKPTSHERRRLGSVLPALLKRIQRGMLIIGTDEEVRKKFLSALMRCHTKVINTATDSSRKAARAAPNPTPSLAPAPKPAEPASTLDNIPTLCEVVEMPEDSSDMAAFASRGAGAVAPTFATSEPALPPEFGFDTLSDGAGEDALPPEFEKAAAGGMSSEIDGDTQLAETLPPFKSLIIKNPFGDGEIEVEEVNLDDLPAFSSTNAGPANSLTSRSGDEYSFKAGSIAVGAWIEMRSAGDVRTQARLSWISPLKGTYLFTNRHGAKVAEFSLYQLAKEMRQGGCVIMEEVPLFDRAMSSLVGVLRKELH